MGQIMDIAELDGKTLEYAASIANKDKFKLDPNKLLATKEENSADKRTALKVVLPNDSPLSAVAIGLNPSYAEPGQTDRTITMVSKILYGLGFGEFRMLNLFTYRNKDSKKLEKEVKRLRAKNKEHEIWTNFSAPPYKEWLEDADAIFIICGIGAFEKYPEACSNMLKALNKLLGADEARAKTWKVVDEEQNWLCSHPRNWKYKPHCVVRRFYLYWPNCSWWHSE